MHRFRPRRQHLFVAAALLALSAVIAACGSSSDKRGESPQALLGEATLQGIESGKLEVALNLNARGSEGGKLNVSLAGPFQGEGKSSLPQLEMTARAQGNYNKRKIDFDGGLTLLPNSAYVNYEGVDYEVDPTTFAFVESTLKQAQREAGAETGAAGVAGCQEEFGTLAVADFLEDGKNEGSADVGGTSTTKVSGNLNVGGAIDALVEVSESPACRAQLAAAGPLPSADEIEAAKDDVDKAVKTAHVDVYVGDDDIVRRIAAELKIEPEGGGKGPKSLTIDFDLQFTGVNEEQTVSAPESAKPLSRLFIKLNINPIELLGLLQGEESEKDLGELFGQLGEAAGDSNR